MSLIKLGDVTASKKLALFDCDGVLLDSNFVKLAAVDHALAHYPQALRKCCKDSFRRNFGRPRHWHFQAFEQLISPTVPTAHNFVARCTTRYEDYLHLHYRTARAVTGAQQLLALLAERGVKCAVVSGGKEAEIAETLGMNGIAHYMVRIVGSPTAKTAAINALLEQLDCSATDAVFLGDAVADADAAIKCNVPFIFVSGHALVSRSTISADWPAGHWAGEVQNLLPDNLVSPFSASYADVKEDI